MAGRRCASRTQQDAPCRGYALSDAAMCFHHDPGSEDVRHEARRLGGLRRRKEASIAGAYDIEGFRTTEDLHRVLEVALFDILGTANSDKRNRTLLRAIKTAMELSMYTEMEAELARVKRALNLQENRGGVERLPASDVNPEAYKDAKTD